MDGSALGYKALSRRHCLEQSLGQDLSPGEITFWLKSPALGLFNIRHASAWTWFLLPASCETPKATPLGKTRELNAWSGCINWKLGHHLRMMCTRIFPRQSRLAEISQRIVCPGCSSKSWASLSVGNRSENTRPLECPAKGGAALPSGLALPLPFSLFERRRNKAPRAKSITRCLGVDFRQEESRGDP